jgi:hypothetical protein
LLYGVHIAMELERQARKADRIKDEAMAVIRSSHSGAGVGD